MKFSEQCDKVLKAYTDYFAEVTNPRPTENNSFFKSKYAPLDGIIDHIKPILAKHGLAFFQSIGSDGDMISVQTTLTHSSGQWVQSDRLWIKNQLNKGVSEAQAVGISITYARRYSLGFLGFATDSDNDGNFGTDKKYNSPTNYQRENISQPNSSPTGEFASFPPVNNRPKSNLSEKQIGRMYAIGKQAGYSQDQVHTMIHETFNKSTKDLTKAEYDRICDGFQSVIDNKK